MSLGFSIIAAVMSVSPGKALRVIEVPVDARACMQMTLEGRPIDAKPSPEDLFIDAYCAELVSAHLAPDGNGVVSIFGSASVKPNHVVYHTIKQLIAAWSGYQRTRPAGEAIPVLTGGGPGVMEAANCGVNEVPTAIGPDAGTIYRSELARRLREGNPPNLSAGFASTFAVPPGMPASHQSGSRDWELNGCVTEGYIFRSFNMREAEMIDRARINLVAPGGFGTEWELFEILTKIQTGKAPPRSNGGGRPLVILFTASELDPSLPVATEELERVAGGAHQDAFAQQKVDVDLYWQSLFQRLKAMRRLGTIKPQHLALIKCARTASEALTLMKANAEGYALNTSVGACAELELGTP